jgi:hypothetical protein
MAQAADLFDNQFDPIETQVRACPPPFLERSGPSKRAPPSSRRHAGKVLWKLISKLVKKWPEECANFQRFGHA